MVSAGSGLSAPLVLTRFFGREAEGEELTRLLERSRLVTLVGAPGCGKTRLGQEVAATLTRRFSDGACHIELAAVGEPSSTTHAVAAALGVRDRPRTSAEDAVIEHLAGRELLLVLDNCEHVVTAAAHLARRVLAECPAVRLLATSRRALCLRDERVWRVLPLDLEPAIELFLDRAELAAGRAPAAEGRGAIERICRRLDGVPLAIELAAAATRVLTPAEIVGHLEPVLSLPGGLQPGGSRRQHTMEATVDWSYRLLGPDEQRLFEELSVFGGGFDLAAARWVATGDPVQEHLMSLGDHSLVLTVPVRGEEPRYRLLEPVRQFAARRLAARGDQEAIRIRHAEHYLDLATRADAELRRSEPRRVLDRLERDEANFRLALEMARDQRTELGLRLCTALARSWALGGRVTEGRAQLEEMLKVETPDLELRCSALAVASRLAWRQLDYGGARRWLEESLSLSWSLGDLRRVARRLRNLAMIALTEGDLDQAQRLCREAVAAFRYLGDDYGLGLALASLGVTLQLAGRDEEARTQALAALELSRATGNLMGAIYGLAGLVFNAVAAGDREAIAALAPYQEETVRLLRALAGMSEDPGWMWMVVSIACAVRQDDLALRLACAVEAKAGSEGVQFHEPFRRYVEPWLESARARVGPARAAELAIEGSRLTADQLADECLSALEAFDQPPPTPPGQNRWDRRARPLSRREREVASLIARGLANGEIAEQLAVSKRTVESHIAHIKRKLAVTGRSQIVAWAATHPWP